jgi:ketosteroid isomerase-like protein
MKRPWSVVVCVLLAAPVWPGPADDEAAIRKRLQNWVHEFNTGDYEAAATVWAPDLVGWWGPPGTADDTFEREIGAAKRGAPPGTPKTTFELKIEEVMVSGEMAVVRDIWTETTAAKEGGQPTRKTFRSFEVSRRQPDATWKISRWIDGPEKEVP